MTKRLYYADTFLHEFEGTVVDVIKGDKSGVVLDQTAFYPTSGGQVFDVGKLVSNGSEVTVQQVEENEQGHVVHYVSAADAENVKPGQKVRGFIDTSRRRDHMQQHSGQHVLSAAFEKLFQMPTVSFHMGEESCTIDLMAANITNEQMKQAERLANQVIWENRPVQIRFVSLDEAKKLGLRKLPDTGREELRLIEIADFDLCACGGTHVESTAQIGAILVRKAEKVKQGFRVEFVCGERALNTARKDFDTLTEAGALFSANIYDVPRQITKLLEESKSAQKTHHKLLEDLSEFVAGELLSDAVGQANFHLIKAVFHDRELAFVKLVAQKLAQQSRVVALLGTTLGQPTIVCSRSQDVGIDVSLLLKEVLTAAGGRGGGTKDLAQGGVPDASGVQQCLDQIAAKLA